MRSSLPLVCFLLCSAVPIGAESSSSCKSTPSFIISKSSSCTSYSAAITGSASSQMLAIPRGGAWYFGKKTAARKYRMILEEQVSLLDKQLRQSQEELSLLRRQLKTSQSLLHRSGNPGIRSAEERADRLKALSENQELKKRVESLTHEVAYLEKMRDDLQAIIENQHKRMEELEFQLKAQADESSKIIQRAEREMERLKQEIEAKYQKQIEELTALMNRRVEEAVEHARQVALREMEAKIAQATAEERKRGEKLLEEERKRSDAAVEREKVKMRKLAKALFEREKKLNTLDKDLSDSPSIKGSSPIVPASKTMNSSFKVDTIRKF